MKIKKRTKSSRMPGRNMGTHGRGARKKAKKSGHRGGKGMSGSGKRADHKKTLITKLYGHKYFGKQGITSKGTKRDKANRINIGEIGINLEKYGANKKGDALEINLKKYKILGTGEVQGSEQVQASSSKKRERNKLIIYAKAASKSAIEKVTRKGGKIIIKSQTKKDVKSNGH